MIEKPEVLANAVERLNSETYEVLGDDWEHGPLFEYRESGNAGQMVLCLDCCIWSSEEDERDDGENILEHLRDQANTLLSKLGNLTY